MVATNVFKCDCCGALFEQTEDPVIKIKVRPANNGPILMSMDDLDLCAKCGETIINTIEALKKAHEKKEG